MTRPPPPEHRRLPPGWRRCRARPLLKAKLSRAEPSPFLCKQCELVPKMLPGGREALKRSVGGFAGAGRVVRTCYRVA